MTAKITFDIPPDAYARFGENLKVWEKSHNVNASLTLWNGEPYVTTNTASPVGVICELDETFFHDFPEWKPYVRSVS